MALRKPTATVHMPKEGNCFLSGTPSPENPATITGVQVEMIVEGTKISATDANGNPVALYGIGDVKDKLVYNGDGTGTVSRKIGTLVLNGTENIMKPGSFYLYNIFAINIPLENLNTGMSQCCSTHFCYEPTANSFSGYGKCSAYKVSPYYARIIFSFNAKTVDDFKEWITSQYSAGTPVIVYHILEAPTTEIVYFNNVTSGAADSVTWDETQLLMKRNNIAFHVNTMDVLQRDECPVTLWIEATAPTTSVTWSKLKHNCPDTKLSSNTWKVSTVFGEMLWLSSVQSSPFSNVENFSVQTFNLNDKGQIVPVSATIVERNMEMEKDKFIFIDGTFDYIKIAHVD